MKKCFLFILCLLALSCSDNKKKGTELTVINVVDALNDLQEINLSQFVESIEYVPLEKNDLSLITMPGFEVTDKYIITRNNGPSAMGPMHLFDRKTGILIRCIGQSGRGPEEFHMGNVPFYNIYTKTIYAIGYNKDIKEYDLEGRFLGSFKLPVMIDEKVDPRFGTPSIRLDQYLENEIFVAGIKNTTGWDKRRIVLFTRDSVIKIFPNYNFWERTNWKSIGSLGLRLQFYRWENKLYIKEEYNDTVFQITESSFIPKYVFQTGNNTPSMHLSEKRPEPEQFSRLFFIRYVCENADYLFFQLLNNKVLYAGFYDKETGETTLCDPKGDKSSAFIDDINNFMPLYPQNTTQNNEMTCLLNAEDIVKWVYENPEKVKSFGPEMNWVDTISLTSNPVIVIAKFKE